MHAELAPTDKAYNVGRFNASDGVWYNHWGIILFDTFEGGEEYFVGFNLVPADGYYFTLTSEVILNVLGTDRQIHLKPLYMNADGSVYYSNGFDQIRFVGGEPHRITVNEGYAVLDKNGDAVTEAVPGQRVRVHLLKEYIGDDRYVVMGTDKGRVVVYRAGESEPFMTTDTFVYSLPKSDKQKLEQGIIIEGEAALRKTLEDYCS